MSVFRSIAALFIGYITTPLISMFFYLYINYEELMAPNLPDGPLQLSNTKLLAMQIVGFIGCILGGYLCALIAGRKQWLHGYILIGIMVGWNLIGAFLNPNLNTNNYPIWFHIAGMIIMIAGVWLGVRLKVGKQTVTQDLPPHSETTCQN